jgi:Phage tail assembly chaperone protein, TAC
MKRWAFGALKLKPDEFWSLTATELEEMLEAFWEEEKRQDDVTNQRVSWQTAHLMNATGNYKKRIKSTDLYKPVEDVEQAEETPKQNIVTRFETAEQKEEYMKDLMSKFGK